MTAQAHLHTTRLCLGTEKPSSSPPEEAAAAAVDGDSDSAGKELEEAAAEGKEGTELATDSGTKANEVVKKKGACARLRGCSRAKCAI